MEDSKQYNWDSLARKDFYSKGHLLNQKNKGRSQADFKRVAIKVSKSAKDITDEIKFLQLMLWASDWTYISPTRNRDNNHHAYLRTLQREFYGE